MLIEWQKQETAGYLQPVDIRWFICSSSIQSCAAQLVCPDTVIAEAEMPAGQEVFRYA